MPRALLLPTIHSLLFLSIFSGNDQPFDLSLAGGSVALPPCSAQGEGSGWFGCGAQGAQRALSDVLCLINAGNSNGSSVSSGTAGKSTPAEHPVNLPGVGTGKRPEQKLQSEGKLCFRVMGAGLLGCGVGLGTGGHPLTPMGGGTGTGTELPMTPQGCARCPLLPIRGAALACRALRG